jgi:hypothetical protein
MALRNGLRNFGIVEETTAMNDDPYSRSSIPGTADPGRRVRLPGSRDRSSFWNPNQIAPYNPPGEAEDRVLRATFRRLSFEPRRNNRRNNRNGRRV